MPAPWAKYGTIGCAASPSKATRPWACSRALRMGGRILKAHKRQLGTAWIKSLSGLQVPLRRICNSAALPPWSQCDMSPCTWPCTMATTLSHSPLRTGYCTTCILGPSQAVTCLLRKCSGRRACEISAR